jgi:hypothetical protein
MANRELSPTWLDKKGSYHSSASGLEEVGRTETVQSLRATVSDNEVGFLNLGMV